MTILQIFQKHLDQVGEAGAAATLTLCELIQSQPISDKPLSVAQAAERLNLPPRTVYDLCATGKLQHQRHGKRSGTIRILPKAIDNYLRKAS